ncbi:amidohydrolase [Arthrobacter dokdonensis]|uniref:amidohydrolase n=1 Tax=Arthrobacter dokdonellae TaxID=2211210 RepID=UPI000DE5A888|nr:amidohydrolase [Arthrobacter dokdonellae]
MKIDLILSNANVITMDPARPAAHTIGVLNGRIVALDDELRGLGAREHRDLNGATVTPGFNDSHCHTTWFGLGLAEIDLASARGLDEVYRRLEEAAGGTAAGQWLRATGFNHRDHGGAFPELAVMDRLTGDRPLYIRHTSGHMALANSASMRLAGVLAADFPDPDGGVICRDDAGHPTGLLQENAQQLIQNLILPYSQADIVEALDRGTTRYAQEGITSFTEAGVGGGWIGHSPAEFAAYQRARTAGSLHARAQLMPALDMLHPLAANPDDDFGLGLDLGICSGFGDEYLSLGPAKVFLDGSLFSETAALTEDYCGHAHGPAGPAIAGVEGTREARRRGYFQADPRQMRDRILGAYRSGWSIAAHAIGDRAVDLALDVLTEAVRRYGPPSIPNRIEHASLTRPEHLPKLKAADIAVTPQSSFFAPMGDAMTASLGTERARYAYRARSFIDAGILMPGSSDRPVADGNVLAGIQAYVDRRTASGQIFGSPDERITAYQALAAYTSVAARATGFGATKGNIAPGMLADFAILSDSPLSVPTQEIAGIKVRATVVGGTFTNDRLD